MREVQEIAEEKLRPVNQGLILTGLAMSFTDFVTNTYIPTYLTLLSSSTQDSYRGVLSKYLEPRFSHLCLRDLTRLTIQQYFSCMAGKMSHPTISKIRDVLSSILRSEVDVDYLIKSPMEGLRLPLDKRPRQPKPTITPAQFHKLVQFKQARWELPHNLPMAAIGLCQEPRCVTGRPWGNRGESAGTCQDYSSSAHPDPRHLRRQQSRQHVSDRQRLVLSRPSTQGA